MIEISLRCHVIMRRCLPSIYNLKVTQSQLSVCSNEVTFCCNSTPHECFSNFLINTPLGYQTKLLPISDGHREISHSTREERKQVNATFTILDTKKGCMYEEPNLLILDPDVSKQDLRDSLDSYAENSVNNKNNNSSVPNKNRRRGCWQKYIKRNVKNLPLVEYQIVCLQAESYGHVLTGVEYNASKILSSVRK